MGLCYLCGVSSRYVTDRWGVSSATARKTALALRDSLAQWYRENSALRRRDINAIHTFLTAGGYSVAAPSYVASAPDAGTAAAVTEDIMQPMLSLVKRETRLPRIFAKDKPASTGIERLAIALTSGHERGQAHPRGEYILEAVLGEVLQDIYRRFIDDPRRLLPGVAQPLTQAPRRAVNRVYDLIADGLEMRRNPMVNAYARRVMKERDLAVSETVSRILALAEGDVLTKLEMDVVRSHFGSGPHAAQTIEEIGRGLGLTREHVVGIRDASIEKLRRSAAHEVTALEELLG